MVIYGVSFDVIGKQPIVLLKTVEGNRFLPIWIGHPEAAAILIKLQGTKLPRPMTHDLLTSIIGRFEADVARITVTELKDSTFYATPHARQGRRRDRRSTRDPATRSPWRCAPTPPSSPPPRSSTRTPSSSSARSTTPRRSWRASATSSRASPRTTSVSAEGTPDDEAFAIDQDVDEDDETTKTTTTRTTTDEDDDEDDDRTTRAAARR